MCQDGFPSYCPQLGQAVGQNQVFIAIDTFVQLQPKKQGHVHIRIHMDREVWVPWDTIPYLPYHDEEPTDNQR